MVDERLCLMVQFAPGTVPWHQDNPQGRFWADLGTLREVTGDGLVFSAVCLRRVEIEIVGNGIILLDDGPLELEFVGSRKLTAEPEMARWHRILIGDTARAFQERLTFCASN